MNLEFWSGLLLVLTVLAILTYILKELFSDFRPGSLWQRLGAVFAEQGKREAKPVNQHLIGTLGEVTALSDDDDRPMRVRLGLELWPARADSPQPDRFPIGTPIEVTAVRGPIVVVRDKESRDRERSNA